MTQKMRSLKQAAESFFHWVAGLSIRDRPKSSDIRETLRVEPLLLSVERSQLRSGLARMPPGPTCMPVREEKTWQTVNTLERLYLSTGLQTSCCPLEELLEVQGGETSRSPFSDSYPCDWDTDMRQKTNKLAIYIREASINLFRNDNTS